MTEVTVKQIIDNAQFPPIQKEQNWLERLLRSVEEIPVSEIQAAKSVQFFAQTLALDAWNGQLMMAAMIGVGKEFGAKNASLIVNAMKDSARDLGLQFPDCLYRNWPAKDGDKKSKGK